MPSIRLALLSLAVVVAAAPAPGQSPSPPPAAPPGADPKAVAGAIAKGRAFLKAHQAEDGSFSAAENPGITALVAIGLARTGDPADPTLRRALAAIERQVDPATGSICKGAPSHLTNYLTSINVLALATADPAAYRPIIGRAARFLVDLQFDERKQVPPGDVFYGGVGYDGVLRPDLSNTTMTIQAVAAAGVSPSDPFFRKALVYVGRCQNLKGPSNDQPWAGLIDDGSFLYGCGPAAERMYTYYNNGLELKPGDPHQGYGSMTAAGLVALDLCGVGRDDPRFAKAFRWLSDEFTADANPGLDGPLGGCAGSCHYYYLAHAAKALDRLAVAVVVDRKGRARDWRAEFARALLQRQRPDGSWQNETPLFLEGNPDVATAWALITLGHCGPKAGPAAPG